MQMATISGNNDFEQWVIANPNISYQFAEYLVYTLPHPREDFYDSASFLETQRKVLQEINSVNKELG
jgi:hypothetical protein